ncbi:hypothetical protein OC834_000064 [Tilletia horrida]|nr:hypothetical protein OC835_003953 [Tilletia horrida]KAK0539345.1 hypothetical protein OC834_000064 [Tilletia horrida]
MTVHDHALTAEARIQDLLTIVRDVLESPDFPTLTNGSTGQAQFIQDFLPLVAAIRLEARLLSDAAREQKNGVVEERGEVEDKLVQLQNLQYQEDKLEEEIQLTRGLRSIYQDVDMPSEDDFRATAPDELKTDEVLQDEHLTMMHRLDHELSERQRLDAERREHAREKLGLLKVNRNRDTRLKGLEKALRTLLEQAITIRDAGPSQQQ